MCTESDMLLVVFLSARVPCCFSLLLLYSIKAGNQVLGLSILAVSKLLLKNFPET